MDGIRVGVADSVLQRCCALHQCCFQVCSVVEGVNHASDVLPALMSLAEDNNSVTHPGMGHRLADGYGAVSDLADPPGGRRGELFLGDRSTQDRRTDRKSTRLNSSHANISYAV